MLCSSDQRKHRYRGREDAVEASVTPISPTPQLTTINGNEAYHPGTYSVGTIQLLYVVNEFSFPTGPFASFSLEIQNTRVSDTGQAAEYPTELSLHQTGSNNLEISSAPDSYPVTDIGLVGVSTITISIPEGVSSENGTVLVGNLQISTPPKAHLNTVTTIQVKLMLVHPTSCLSLLHFVSDQDFEEVQPVTDIRLAGGMIKSNSPGQFADNILVVNRCDSSHQFDLMYSLDPAFETNPAGNPGNAVFTFATGGELTPESSLTVFSGNGTPHGQLLCLQNMTVAGNSTFLATVHMHPVKGSDPGISPFEFFAQAFSPTASLQVCGTGVEDSFLSPDPIAATLPFNIK